MNKIDAIQLKVSILEKQLQFFKFWSMAMGLGLLFLLLTSTRDKPQEVFERLTTKQLKLVDKKGRTLMLMQPAETAGTVTIFNEDGKELLYLGADKEGEGGFIQLANKKGQNAIQIRSNKEGSAIKLYDKKQKNLIFIGEDAKNEGAALINLSMEGKRKIIFDGQQSKIFLANEESKTGFVEVN